MKKILCSGLLILTIILGGCGGTNFSYNASQENKENTIKENYQETESKKDSTLLSEMIGKYEYVSECAEDGIGVLEIYSDTEYDFINITDWEYGEEGLDYRFMANSSNVELEDDNKIYLKYPVMVYEDGLEIFDYYILEKTEKGLDVYYSDISFDDTKFLYSAADSAKKNTDDIKIEPYVYPQEFTLGTNLEGAITELALSYDNFDASKTKEENYPEFFVDNYCQNSRMSFDYINQIAKENKGIISREQIEYMQYSLTNEFVDFKNIVPKEGIDYNDSSSGYSHGDIISYDAQVSKDETKLTAEFVIVQDYSHIRTIYELNIILVRNPESCFDGYSIKSLTSKDITPVVYGDNKEHTIIGFNLNMEEENSGIFFFENFGGKDNIVYDTHITIDLSDNPTLADFVRENPGEEFDITYLFDDSMTEPVYEVVPIDIKIHDENEMDIVFLYECLEVSDPRAQQILKEWDETGYSCEIFISDLVGFTPISNVDGGIAGYSKDEEFIIENVGKGLFQSERLAVVHNDIRKIFMDILEENGENAMDYQDYFSDLILLENIQTFMSEEVENYWSLLDTFYLSAYAGNSKVISWGNIEETTEERLPETDTHYNMSFSFYADYADLGCYKEEEEAAVRINCSVSKETGLIDEVVISKWYISKGDFETSQF